MNTTIKGRALVALIALAGAGPALAGEVTFDMFALGKTGMGDKIGQISLDETADGVTMKLDLKDLPPGKDRLFLYEDGDCSIGMDDMAVSQMAELNVETDEDGAEPLKTTVNVAGMTMADMMGQAVIVERGSLGESQQREQTGAPRRVACGLVK